MNKLNEYKKRFKLAAAGYILIIIIAAALFPFYYQAYAKMPRMTGIHPFEYYTTAAMLTEAVKNLDFKGFISIYLNSYTDKLCFLMRIPFMLIFGQSMFVHFASIYLINILLLIALYSELLKIESPKKSILFTLILLTSYFFLELMLSPYIDLAYCLLCGIFLIELQIFLKKQSNPAEITMLTLILMLMRNMTYILIPLLIAFLLPYLLITRKKQGLFCWWKFFLLATAGIAAYLLIATFGSGALINRDLSYGYADFGKNIMAGNPSGFINKVKDFISIVFNRGLILNNYPLLKFQGLPYLKSTALPFIILLYSIVAYNLIKKKNKFLIALFLFAEIFWIFFFWIKGQHYDIRYMVMFYFIYIKLIFDFFYEILNIEKKWYAAAISLILIAALATLNLHSISNAIEKSPPALGYITINFKEDVLESISEPETIINFDTGHEINYFAGWTIMMDGKYSKEKLVKINFNLSSLEKIDSRFRYFFSEVPNSNASYVLTTFPEKYVNYTLVNKVESDVYGGIIYLFKRNEH